MARIAGLEDLRSPFGVPRDIGAFIGQSTITIVRIGPLATGVYYAVDNLTGRLVDSGTDGSAVLTTALAEPQPSISIQDSMYIEGIRLDAAESEGAIVGMPGHRTALYLPDGATESMFIIGETDLFNDFKFRDLRLYGRSVGVNLHAFDIRQSRNLWLEDIYVREFTGDGFRATTGDIIDTHVIGCVWEVMEGDGIHIENPSQFLRNFFVGGYSFGNYRGIYLEGFAGGPNWWNLLEVGSNEREGIFIEDVSNQAFCIPRIHDNSQESANVYYNVNITGGDSDGNKFLQCDMQGTVLDDVYIGDGIINTCFIGGRVVRGFTFFSNDIMDATRIEAVQGWINKRMGYVANLGDLSTVAHGLSEDARMVLVTPYGNDDVFVNVDTVGSPTFTVRMTNIADGSVHAGLDIDFFWRAWGRTASRT